MERQARSPPLRALSRKEKGQYLTYGPPVESQDDEISPWPSPLCPAMGARGLFILLDDREDVPEERKHKEVGLWTQTLLARDVLDGWSGLRPYDFTSSGPVEGNREGQRKKVEFPTFSS